MYNNQTLPILRTLKLTGMADALAQQLAQPATHEELGFEERLALLVDRETTYRNNHKVTRLLKAARLKLQAFPEDIDYRHPRGLHKSQFADLLSSHWIYQHHNVLITGPTGCGKTYLGCVLATLADAILDRLLHNSHKIKLKGESMRKDMSKTNEDELSI